MEDNNVTGQKSELRGAKLRAWNRSKLQAGRAELGHVWMVS